MIANVVVFITTNIISYVTILLQYFNFYQCVCRCVCVCLSVRVDTYILLYMCRCFLYVFVYCMIYHDWEILLYLCIWVCVCVCVLMTLCVLKIRVNSMLFIDFCPLLPSDFVSCAFFNKIVHFKMLLFHIFLS